MKANKTTAFLVLNFGITWISIFIVWMYGISIPSDAVRIIDYLPFLIIVIPTSFGPAIASFSVRKWITKEGFSDAGLNLNFFKNWKYYLFALLFPLLVVFGIASLVVLTGLGILSFSNLSLTQLFLFLILSIITTPYIWGEEFGWRGYLQLRVYVDRPVRAALVTGLIHGIWHYPMIFFGFLAADLPLLSAWLLYPLMTTSSAFIYGWLRLKTGSIWPASLDTLRPIPSSQI